VGRALRYTLLALVIGGTAQAAPRVKITPARLETVLDAIRKPGARAVLVNVWATWCEPCREEMPDLIRAYRAHKAQGLRLVLVSSDDEENRAEAEKFLTAQGVDVDSFLKVGDDMAFINGIEKRWTGALPASFIFDGRGRLLQFWPRQITHDELDAKLTEALKRRTR
jgi:thiol-disulfide isomerase/thioredoxin